MEVVLRIVLLALSLTCLSEFGNFIKSVDDSSRGNSAYLNEHFKLSREQPTMNCKGNLTDKKNL